ncbi:hypothetical protein K6I33_000833 [Streptomyces sp. UNOB3_S3]|nr:hypothetical protein [Streptomyces sp. UNOB3_S3]MCC3776470.1 hypothetical protein [Streptomyces sp. UNOB3_S3]
MARTLRRHGWSHQVPARRALGANTAFTDPDHLVRVLRHGLRQIQYRSHLIDGCLTATGLTL